jgi:hypothetical protein
MPRNRSAKGYARRDRVDVVAEVLDEELRPTVHERLRCGAEDRRRDITVNALREPFGRAL